MTTPNSTQIYRWVKATLENIPVTNNRIFTKTDGNNESLTRNELLGRLREYPYQDLYFQEEIPQSLPLTEEVKETAEDIFEKNYVQINGQYYVTKDDFINIFTAQFSTSVPYKDGEDFAEQLSQEPVSALLSIALRYCNENDLKDLANHLLKRTSLPVSEEEDFEMQNRILESQLIIADQKIEQLESEEEKNVYREEGWIACGKYEASMDYDGNESALPNKEHFLSSFLQNKQ